MGISLCSGFAVMTAIDMLMNAKGELQKDEQKESSNAAIAQDNLQDKYFAINEDKGQKLLDAGNTNVHSHTHFDKDKNPVVTTLGLVVHSIADGVALGSSIYCKLNILSVFDIFDSIFILIFVMF